MSDDDNSDGFVAVTCPRAQRVDTVRASSGSGGRPIGFFPGLRQTVEAGGDLGGERAGYAVARSNPPQRVLRNALRGHSSYVPPPPSSNGRIEVPSLTTGACRAWYTDDRTGRWRGPRDAVNTLTLASAAKFLYTTPETISEMIRNEGLPAAKVGRAYVLVDVDVIEWLRGRYASASGKGKQCDSTDASPMVRGRSISGTTAGALDRALTPRTSKRQKSGPNGTRPHSGGRTDSTNVLPLRGTKPSSSG